LTRAYVGLGSNLEQPRRQVTRALAELDRIEGCYCQIASSLYLSRPMGPPDQPEYINAVAALESALAPLALLQALQAIELRHGRVREGAHWGPRTLDLALPVYGTLVLDTPELVLPHPGIAEREVVLHPLAEIAPDLEVPGLGPVAVLLAACDDRGIRRLASPRDNHRGPIGRQEDG